MCLTTAYMAMDGDSWVIVHASDLPTGTVMVQHRTE
jgi:hypothetical protein